MQHPKYQSKKISTGSIVLLYFQRALIYTFLIILLIITMFPVYNLFIDATRSTAEINKGVSLVPGNYIDENWKTIKEKTIGITYFEGFVNSFTISTCVTLLTCYISAMTAYGLHSFNFRGRKFLTGFILMIMMIPPQLSMVGFMNYIGSLKLMGTFIPLIIPAAASPFAVFFFLQYYKNSVQVDLVNAARIDGANEFSIFHRIILPIVMPGLAVNAIFTYVGSWNNFMMPFLVLGGNQKRYTMPMMAQAVSINNYAMDTGAVTLALAITVVPLFVIYAFLSKFIIAGVALGGVKE